MDADELERAAARLNADNALGRSDVLRKLFDFLLTRSRTGPAPKEIEVAMAVFGGAPDFDASLDASVRVYVHRLRRKLEAYYDGPGREDAVRLGIPKGEYRLVIEPAAKPVAADRLEPALVTATPSPTRGSWRRPGAIAIAVILALNALAWIAFSVSRSGGGDGFAKVRRSAPWAALLADQRPITLVVGDYYIFGDTDPMKDVDRLVREYSVNSRADLDTFRMKHPDLAHRYQDLDLYYLPVASAFALRNLMPLLAPTAKDRDRIRMVLASDLTPDMLRRTDIVYVGYLSGLGVLRDPVFAGSRFTFGDTYDDMIDTRTNQHFDSQEGGPDEADQQQRDIGYFSTFTGPNGNRVVIVAGDRDIGVMQTAEEATNPSALSAMIKAAGGADAFEAVYNVQGIRRSNLGGALQMASPLKADKIWGPPPSTLQFPAG